MSPEESRQKTCGSLRQNPETLTIKQQAKELFNFAVLDNIIQHFHFTCNQKHFTRRSPTAQKLSLDLYVFMPMDSSGDLDPQLVVLMGELLYFSSRMFWKMKVFQ